MTRPAVVIGGGLCGLSAALHIALARPEAKPPVILIEKEPHTGGAVVTYRRAGFSIDTPQMTPDLGPLLDFFGVALPMVRVTGDLLNLYLVHPDREGREVIRIPSNPDLFPDRLGDPSERPKIRKFLFSTARLYRSMNSLPFEPRLSDLPALLFRHTRLVWASGKTFGRFVKGFNIKSRAFQETANAFCGLSGLPASRAAALFPVAAMQSLLGGAFRPADGFGALPRALTERLQALGGEVRTRCRATRILVKRGRAAGVELENGEILETDRIVAALDPHAVMEKLVDATASGKRLTDYLSRLSRAEMSASAFTVNLGLNSEAPLNAAGLSEGYNVLTTGGDTLERLYAVAKQGALPFNERRFHFGVTLRRLPPSGRPVLTLGAIPMPPEPWISLRTRDPEGYHAQRNAVADRIIALAEKHLCPGLRGAVEMTDISTPATYARYSGSPTGSVYDMAPALENFGASRLPSRTPVEGLTLPRFMHGIYPALRSAGSAD